MKHWMKQKPSASDIKPSDIKQCSRCYGAEGKDCHLCGGTGYRKRCRRGECAEHGCSGYGDCHIEHSAAKAVLSQKKPSRGLRDFLPWVDSEGRD